MLRALAVGLLIVPERTKTEPEPTSRALLAFADPFGYRTLFGGVEIKKSYVSAHLMAVYMHPEMLDGVDPALRKHMQGKSCFNFKAPDDPALDAFAALVEASAARFAAEGRF